MWALSLCHPDLCSVPHLICVTLQRYRCTPLQVTTDAARFQAVSYPWVGNGARVGGPCTCCVCFVEVSLQLWFQLLEKKVTGVTAGLTLEVVKHAHGNSYTPNNQGICKHCESNARFQDIQQCCSQIHCYRNTKNLSHRGTRKCPQWRWNQTMTLILSFSWRQDFRTSAPPPPPPHPLN